MYNTPVSYSTCKSFVVGIVLTHALCKLIAGVTDVVFVKGFGEKDISGIHEFFKIKKAVSMRRSS